MALCIKCNRREAVPGGNLCEEDSIGGPPATYIGGTYNISGGNVAAVGDNSFQRTWSQESGAINLDHLAIELSKLREELKRRATTADQDAAIGDVAAAETAARKGDGPTTLQRLNAAGMWVFSVAKDIGLGAAVEAAKSALGF